MLRSKASMARPRACSMSWSRLHTRRGMPRKVQSRRNSAFDSGTTTPRGDTRWRSSRCNAQPSKRTTPGGGAARVPRRRSTLWMRATSSRGSNGLAM